MKLRWVLLFFCLGIVLFVAGSLVSVPKPPAGELASNGPWSRVGTVMSTLGVLLSLSAFCYAISVAIRTDRSLKSLNEVFQATQEEIRAETEQRRAQHEAAMLSTHRLREQMEAQHEATMKDIQQQGERTQKSFRRLFWELERRLTLSDTIQQLTSRSADLFLFSCKKAAQQQGYLNLLLHPKRHYELNQRGIDLLNALSPSLPEQIADLSVKEMSSADLLFELNLPVLYGLMERVLKEQEALTFHGLLGVVVVYGRGGSDLT